MKSDAQFSADRRYRWWLTREWDPALPWCAFIGLNPSTADETKNDNTISREIYYATSWGHGGLLMLNLYAYRTPYPREMWAARRRGVDVVGAENYLEDLVRRVTEEFAGVSRTVAAWGKDGGDRGRELGRMGVKLDCLEKLKDGHPHHPLYLPNGLQPQPWNYQT